MSETLTMNETPADQPALNADEQESLAIAEANEAEQQSLLAGKFKDTQTSFNMDYQKSSNKS